MSNNEIIIQTLEDRLDKISMWTPYSDGFKSGLEFAIGLIELTMEFETKKEMEAIND